MREILAQHAGKVVTRQQIMKQVGGGPHLDDTHYLRIVVRKLRKKIEVDLTRPRILLTELGMVIAWCNSGGGQRSPAGSPSRNSGFIHSNDRYVAAFFWREGGCTNIWHYSAGARRAGVPPSYSKMER